MNLRGLRVSIGKLRMNVDQRMAHSPECLAGWVADCALDVIGGDRTDWPMDILASALPSTWAHPWGWKQCDCKHSQLWNLELIDG